MCESLDPFFLSTQQPALRNVVVVSVTAIQTCKKVRLSQPHFNHPFFVSNSKHCFVLVAGSSGQVCRPHFHSALHPWDASKSLVPHPHSSGWISPFAGKHPSSSPLGGGAGPSTSSSASNPFNFPPTPPKDTTPDVSGSAATGTNGVTGPNGGQSSNDYSPAGEQSKEPGSSGSGGGGGGSLNGDATNGYSSAAMYSGMSKKSSDSLSDNPYSGASLCSYPSSVYSYPGSSLYSSSSKSAAGIKAEGHPHHSTLAGDPYSSALSSYSTSLSSMGGSMGGTAHPMPTYAAYMGPDYASSALFHPANMLKAASLARCRTKTRSSSGEGEMTFY